MATRIIPGRTAEMVIGADGVLALKIFDEDPALYNSRAIGDPVIRTGYPGQVVDAPGSTVLRLLDIPTLRDDDDGPGFYASVRGVLDNWSSAALYSRTDATEDYQRVKTFDTAAAIGFCRSILGDGPTTTWDTVSTLDVELLGGELVSLSADEALRGQIAYLVGNEILLCQGVEQLTAKTWRLHGPFVRGWKGTEWATTDHIRNERFVVLQSPAVLRVNDQLSDIGIERMFKAVTAGLALEDTIAQRFTNTGISLKPWAPVDIAVTVDGGDNIVGTFRRRSRLQGRNGRDFYDPPLGEATESYEIDILSDDELTVHRTLTSTTEAFTYTDAQQIEDFGGLKAFNLHLNIYQISAAVGRGYPGHAVLDPSGIAEGGAFAFYFQDGALMTFEDDEAFLFEH